LGIEYPSVDQGLITSPITHVLDLGYVTISAEYIVDYGNLGVAGTGAEPNFSSQVISGSMDSGEF
jgi:hypothetical protein